MFETAEIGHKLGKSQYKREEPKVRARLLALQYRLLDQARFPVVILVNGVDGAGKGETVNLLNEWMDPRHIRTRAFGPPGDDARERPEMWRYWKALPAKGRIGILFGSWYTDPILQRVMGHEKRGRFDRRLERIRHFERMLVSEGVLLIKLWFHLSKKAQGRRLEQLSARKSTAWRVRPVEWKHHKHYGEFIATCEEALRDTSTGEAPWDVVDGSDAEYRALTVGRLVADRVAARLAGKRAKLSPPPPPPAPPIDRKTLLSSLDYSHRLGDKEYKRRLAALQAEIAILTRSKAMRERSVVIAFEGMDAAGKGSTIRRITNVLDARYYRVIPIAAPSEEERAQPYLWRFWRRVPRHGQVAIFDRSWYGRVLVERVEGYAPETDWMRAYSEINEFEDQLAEAGAIVVKFWLSITRSEQLRRFRAREETSYKRYKIGAEDWRNRRKWPAYEAAVADMVERTSTHFAPWHIVASDDKHYARIAVLEMLRDRLDQAL
jgi:AMP-polyphosphate phosphotransferase